MPRWTFKVLFGLLLIAIIVFSARQQLNSRVDFQEGWAAYKQGDYEAALHEWTPLAERGDKEAQFNLGLIYEHGKSVAQDYKTAAEWYRLAANQGLAHAQNNLGMLYQHGKGVIQNDQLAFYWYKRAAEQALADAEFNLSIRYKKGAGVKQDPKKAAEWRQRAVEQGHAAAQSTLGLMYAIGECVPEDRVYAYMWIDIGASGNGEAQRVLLTDLQDQIAQEMTPAQIAKAEELARACIRKQYKDC